MAKTGIDLLIDTSLLGLVSHCMFQSNDRARQTSFKQNSCSKPWHGDGVEEELVGGALVL